MAAVKISPKYQVELIPVQPVKQMRRSLKGIDTRIDREPDRP
jgi:hypothetical protein